MGAKKDTKGKLGWKGEKVAKAMGVFVVETVVWPSSPGRLNKTRNIDLECPKTKHIKKKYRC